ncbi:hypothetical protein D3227_19725 [Mesorhizobium waimense]|uniref:Uncharacterized protein n=1 Tax=Mesorhizobium waimense TaxID=1300307 RepID=A0A3A5KKN9_9HYPH|nr:hypothetical protein D3227_19725 [Mesorhizobium waimense]
MSLLFSEANECQGCSGTGRIFECPRWRASNGHCCPAGTHRHICHGTTVHCSECAGTGGTARRQPPARDRGNQTGVVIGTNGTFDS